MTHSSSQGHQDQGRGDGDMGKTEEQSGFFKGVCCLFLFCFLFYFVRVLGGVYFNIFGEGCYKDGGWTWRDREMSGSGGMMGNSQRVNQIMFKKRTSRHSFVKGIF